MAQARKLLASGRPYVWYEACGSTNDEAIGFCKRGEEGPLWVGANRQIRGRGRSRRTWQSEEGNLHASLLLSLACAPNVIPQLSLIVGVAAFDAVCAAIETKREEPIDIPLWLKWPNDIMISDKKVGGVLIETDLRSSTEKVTTVIGVGLNLLSCPRGVDRPVTYVMRYLEPHGGYLKPIDVLSCLDGNLMHLIDVWNYGENFDHIRARWLERSGKVGDKISVNTGTGYESGYFDGIDQHGYLLIRTSSGGLKTISFGDVEITGS